eukprot:TRINITY_DN22_c0_g1_i1.p2 TRINITY_DN22_c0_g1~~TRINITY_DN22_c0_g1_i1.p2  ORF type:complete len:101 (-),score=22.46 TRINITY_DN22_c0_g1_i1:41-343(-)
MGKGTPSFGKKQTKTHMLCRRCGQRSYHKQKHRCASCGFGASASMRKYNWGYKALRRRTTGTGKMRYLKTVEKKQAGIKQDNNRYEAQVAKLQRQAVKNQ